MFKIGLTLTCIEREGVGPGKGRILPVQNPGQNARGINSSCCSTIDPHHRHAEMQNFH